MLQCYVSLFAEMLFSASCPGTTDENEFIAISATLCIVTVK